MTTTAIQIGLALLSICGSIGGAFLGAWLASRTFRSQRWWDRKAEVYASIFDNIGAISEQIDKLSDAQMWNNYIMLPEYKEQIISTCDDAGLKLRTISRKNSFVVSDHSKKLLATLISVLLRAEEYSDEQILTDVGRGLRVAREGLTLSARNDLKIND